MFPKKRAMIIKEADKKDVNEITSLYLEGIIDEFKTQKTLKSKEEVFSAINKNWQVHMLKKGLESESEKIIVIREKNKIIGFGHAKISKISKRGLIDKIYILSKFRKMGYAELIIKELLKWLSQKKAKSIRANMLITNKPSLKLFDKFGFKSLYSYTLMERK